MADEKGIFTREQEKALSQKVDDVLKLKGFLELVDGYLARILISIIDDQAIDKLKEAVKVKLAAVADAVIDEDYDAAELALSDLGNSLIDIPGLDEEAEGMIFQGAVQLLRGAIQKWVDSKKAKA